MNGSDRVDSMLQQIAHMLNSNENFEMDDSFQLSFTHVRQALRGSGTKRKMKPGHSHPQTVKQFKHSVVTIINNDELCCTRAIMTAKPKVDSHPNWDGFKKGRKIQTKQAVAFHRKVGVSFGPCGYNELQKLAMASSLYHYQLLIVDTM